jgi:hypothetical protein
MNSKIVVVVIALGLVMMRSNTENVDESHESFTELRACRDTSPICFECSYLDDACNNCKQCLNNRPFLHM